MVLGDLVGIEIDMNDLGVDPERIGQQRKHFREDIGAADDHHIGVGDNPLAGMAEHVADQAAIERVGPRYVEFGRHDAIHARPQHVRQLGQFRLRLRMRDAIAHQNQRVLRPAQQGRHGGDGRRLRNDPRGRHHGRHDRLVVGRVENILGHGEKDGAEGRRCRHLEATPQQAEQTAGIDHPGRVLGDRAGHGDQIRRHLRVHRIVSGAGLAHDDEQGRAPALGVIEAADGVAETDAAMQLHHRRPLRRLGVTVGDADDGRFL